MTGTAAHIYPSADGGPRATTGQTLEQRRNISNGIWLCAGCGRLVDVNEGRSYPSSLLHSWRHLHESRISAEQKGRITRFGWIHQIRIVEDVWTYGEQVLRLSRCNLIIGANGAGKTCLASLLSTPTKPDDLMHRLRGTRSRVEAVVDWLDPQARRMSFIAEQGWLRYNVDGRNVPIVPRPYRCISLDETYLRHGRHDVDGLAARLDIDKWTLLRLLPHVPERSLGRITEVQVVDSEIRIRARGMKRASALKLLSGGLQASLVLELAALLADLQSEVEPVVLVLDATLGIFDLEAFDYMMKMLSSPDRSFQTIMLMTRYRQSPGPEWLVSSMRRGSRGTVISQGLPIELI